MNAHAIAGLAALDKAASHSGRHGGSRYAAAYIAEAREHFELALAAMRNGEPVALPTPAKAQAKRPNGNAGARLEPSQPIKPNGGNVAEFLNAFTGAKA